MPTAPIHAPRPLRGARLRRPGRHRDHAAGGGGREDPPRLIAASRIDRPVCVPSAANTVRADVRVFMSVVNYHGWADWADHMEAKARSSRPRPG